MMVNGGMKLLNFKEMPLNKLRKYVLEHREDEEAWKEFANRPRPNAIAVPAQTSLEEQERILRESSQK